MPKKRVVDKPNVCGHLRTSELYNNFFDRPGCNGNNILAGQLYSVTVNVYFQGFFRIGIIIVSIKVLICGKGSFQAKKRKAYGVMIR